MTVPADHPSRTHRREWRALREAVLARADNRCECRDECGDQHEGFRCGAPHRGLIIRDAGRPADWCEADTQADNPDDVVAVVLTLAHTCACAPACMDAAHVLALCQRCHLRLDREQHRHNAARTRRARSGTLPLPGVEP